MNDGDDRNESVTIPSLVDLREAQERIEGIAHRTPIVRSSQADARAGAELIFKCENLQRVGAFKFRGACNAVFKMSDARPVATHSSGNHAQALALAARLRGVACHVVMPTNAPLAKRSAVLAYGARVIDCEPTLDARERTIEHVVAETGASFVHPYENRDVVAGQATAALEVFEEEEVEFVCVPVGGGGLMAGTCLAAAYVEPSVQVVGAEPALADDAAASLRTGTRQAARTPLTIADGLRTSLGELSFAVARRHLREIVTVEEREIVDAMRFVWERMKLVIEPSAAVPVAAAFRGVFRGRRVAIVLSGGNVDLDRLPWLPHV